MFSDIVSLIVLLAISLTALLLPRYLVRRVEAAAQGVVDERVGRALATHEHALAKQLEEFRQSLGFKTERFSQDYGLFAAQRNKVYAEVYGMYEKARGLFGDQFDLITTSVDFRRSTALDLKHFAATSEHISKGECAELERLSDQDMEQARVFADELQQKLRLRAAHIAFRDLKNAYVLNSLYFSPEIHAVMDEALQKLAALPARAMDLERLARVSYEERERVMNDVGAMVTTLRDAMRQEMQAGFTQVRRLDLAVEKDEASEKLDPS